VKAFRIHRSYRKAADFVYPDLAVLAAELCGKEGEKLVRTAGLHALSQPVCRTVNF
jgi:hypothetical protein